MPARVGTARVVDMQNRTIVLDEMIPTPFYSFKVSLNTRHVAVDLDERPQIAITRQTGPVKGTP
jgi:hypothetical protein